MSKLLNADQVREQVKILRDFADHERGQLDVVRRYWKGRQRSPMVIDDQAPQAVKAMARVARVNICPIVIDSLAQALFVDGFKLTNDESSPVWQAWQANKMDARQTGLHRAAHGYGVSYVIVMPGDPLPVIRCVSPRSFTAVYGEDPDWPMWGLERLGGGLWKLYDEQAVYYVSEEKKARSDGTVESRYVFVSADEHGIGVVPAVRYLDEDDLDADDEVSSEAIVGWEETTTLGQIAPLMNIQDQIDLTTFGLLVAQHYSAFRQRYVLGWLPESEAEKYKATASSIWAFENEGGGNEGLSVGEFGQTNLDGYIKSRDASLKHAATLSQTPVHELLGELVNLSAEALAAAEAGHERKVDERKTLLGESHEQTLRLVGQLMKTEVPDDAQVIWRDTSARTFAATVDGLGKLAVLLKVPYPELWQMIPGVTQQDITRWKAAAESGDAIAQLTALLDRQAQPAA